jgi:hypothetical protein
MLIPQYNTLISAFVLFNSYTWTSILCSIYAIGGISVFIVLMKVWSTFIFAICILRLKIIVEVKCSSTAWWKQGLGVWLYVLRGIGMSCCSMTGKNKIALGCERALQGYCNIFAFLIVYMFITMVAPATQVNAFCHHQSWYQYHCQPWKYFIFISTVFKYP